MRQRRCNANNANKRAGNGVSFEMRSVALADPDGPWVVHTLGERGEWVVCWPSVLSDHRGMLAFATNLATRFRVLLIDPPGYCTNHSRTNLGTLAELSLLVERTLKSMNIAHFHWVGMGMGAHLGVAMQHKNPERMLTATFASMPLIRAARVSLWHRALQDVALRTDFGRRKMVAHVCEQMHGADESERSTVLEYINLAFADSNTEVLRKVRPTSQAQLNALRRVLQTSQVPSLFLAGQHDRFCLPRDQQTAAQLLARSKFLVLDCGFMSMLIKPQESAQAVMEFIDKFADEAPN